MVSWWHFNALLTAPLKGWNHLDIHPNAIVFHSTSGSGLGTGRSKNGRAWSWSWAGGGWEGVGARGEGEADHPGALLLNLYLSLHLSLSTQGEGKCWSPRCFTYVPLYLYLYLCLSVSPRCLTFVVALALLCTNYFHNISCYNIYNISCYNINIPCYAVCSLPKAWLKALDKHFRCWSCRAPWRSWAAELTVWRRRTWGWEVKTKF